EPAKAGGSRGGQSGWMAAYKRLAGCVLPAGLAALGRPGGSPCGCRLVVLVGVRFDAAGLAALACAGVLGVVVVGGCCGRLWCVTSALRAASWCPFRLGVSLCCSWVVSWSVSSETVGVSSRSFGVAWKVRACRVRVAQR